MTAGDDERELLAAAVAAELARTQAARPEDLPSHARLVRASEQFRRAHGLLSVDDLDEWLGRWGISEGEWSAWLLRGMLPARDASPVAVPAERDLYVAAACSGAAGPGAAPPRALRRPTGPPSPPPAAVTAGGGGGRPCVRSAGRRDCGPAALASLLQHHGRPAEPSRIRSLADDGADDRTSLIGLARAARALGFEAQPVKLSRERIDDLPIPALLHVDGDHWIVLYEVAGQAMHVADPGTGPQVLGRDALLARWGGYGLVVQPRSGASRGTGAGSASAARNAAPAGVPSPDASS